MGYVDNMKPEERANQIIAIFSAMFRAKYMKGAIEHKDSDPIENMTPLQLLYNSLDEKIDDLAYTMLAIEKLEKLEDEKK